MKIQARRRPLGGFTLLELLVVIVIVVLVAAATLPTIVPALNRRRVSEAARLLQASLVGAHDAALRAQAPRGIRLLPDPEFSGGSTNGALASNRMISIEAAPEYNTGLVSIYLPPGPVVLNNPYYAPGNEPTSANYFQLSITEEIWANPAPTGIIHGGYNPLNGAQYNTIPNEPTSWYWNIRQGDKIRFTDSGTYYTIAGPMIVGPYSPDPNNPSTLVPTNTQRFINFGPPGSVRNPANGLPTPTGGYSPNPYAASHYPEILYLVNGLDDDNDGWIDESFDGIDNDGDGIIDPGYNGIDDDGDGVVDNQSELLIGNEFEPEAFVGGQFNGAFLSEVYAIQRRPVVSPGAREVALPQGAVIDLTTWNAASAVLSQTNKTPASTTNPSVPILPERSRLPVDPFSYTVDVLIAPNGSVVPAGAGSSGVGQNSAGSAPVSAIPFYHFWIAEREDVQEPLFGFVGVAAPVAGHQGVRVGLPVINPNWPSVPYMLPQPKGATNVAGTVTYQTPSGNNGPYLTGDRRLVTLFTRTGAILTNEIETFDPTNVSAPFYAAQLGTRENK